MDRLFLDANVLFSAAYRPNAGLLRIWALRGCALYSSAYAVAEARAHLAELSQRERLEELCRPLHLAGASSAKLPSGILLPEKDAPILTAAIAANATHLLTGDLRHFREYFGKKVAGVLILLPGEYPRSRAG